MGPPPPGGGVDEIVGEGIPVNFTVFTPIRFIQKIRPKNIWLV